MNAQSKKTEEKLMESIFWLTEDSTDNRQRLAKNDKVIQQAHTDLEHARAKNAGLATEIERLADELRTARSLADSAQARAGFAHQKLIATQVHASDIAEQLEVANAACTEYENRVRALTSEVETLRFQNKRLMGTVQTLASRDSVPRDSVPRHGRVNKPHSIATEAKHTKQDILQLTVRVVEYRNQLKTLAHLCSMVHDHASPAIALPDHDMRDMNNSMTLYDVHAIETILQNVEELLEPYTAFYEKFTEYSNEAVLNLLSGIRSDLAVYATQIDQKKDRLLGRIPSSGSNGVTNESNK